MHITQRWNVTFLWKTLTCCWTISTTVVVFPVPGGPWMTDNGKVLDTANVTASLWDESSPPLK